MLEGTSDLQLVLLPFSSASQQQADELADAAGEGEVSLVEDGDWVLTCDWCDGCLGFWHQYDSLLSTLAGSTS